MWIAYLIPNDTNDLPLLREDGVGFIAKGETSADAKLALMYSLRAEFDDEQVKNIITSHTLHTQELK